jgi:hypothetical protein
MCNMALHRPTRAAHLQLTSAGGRGVELRTLAMTAVSAANMTSFVHDQKLHVHALVRLLWVAGVAGGGRFCRRLAPLPCFLGSRRPGAGLHRAGPTRVRPQREEI